MPADEFIHNSTVLMFTGGVEIEDSYVGTGDRGMSLSSQWRAVGCTTTIVARMFNRLGCFFMSSELGEITGSYLSWPKGIVDSLESE